MMMIVTALGFLMAQDAVEIADARERADGARRKCAALVAGTDGLSTIGMAGTGTDYKLLIVVRDPGVKKSIQDRLGGDQCDGVPILWSVKNPAAIAVAPPLLAAAAPEPVEETLSSDPSSLDYFRRRPLTRIWTYTPPGWVRPWIVWEYRNGWNAYKLRRRDYGPGRRR
jgi:hypothetical protein